MHFTSFLLPIPFVVMLALLSPSHNSDPGSYSGLPSPVPTTVHALGLIATRIQHFLPLSIRVELYLPTMLGDFNSYRSTS